MSRSPQEVEAELSRELSQPITILVLTRKASRRVEFVPPWGNLRDHDYDAGATDRASLTIGTEGGIRGSCMGMDGYYCNVGWREMRVFALEVYALSVIAEQWEEFFSNPERFLAEHWPQWCRVTQAPFTYKIVKAK